MSQVHLFIIKDDCVYLVSAHYRSIKRLLEDGIESILPQLKSRFLDAGYIVLDTNKRLIINGQFAFDPRKCVKGKNIEVIEP